jgi:hypothetical protein
MRKLTTGCVRREALAFAALERRALGRRQPPSPETDTAEARVKREAVIGEAVIACEDADSGRAPAIRTFR